MISVTKTKLIQATFNYKSTIDPDPLQVDLGISTYSSGLKDVGDKLSSGRLRVLLSLASQMFLTPQNI